MKGSFFTFLLFVSAINLHAQDTSEMETDRPDQTETPVLVARKYFQAELGLLKENQGNNNYLLSVPTALLKYGLSNRVELRVELNNQSQYLQLIPKPLTVNGFPPVEIGGKVALFEEKGARPKTSVIGHIGISSLSSKTFKPNEPIGSLRFTMQNSLSKNVALGYNLGLQWDGENDSPKAFYTFAPGFNLSERWYAYVEAFGFIGKEDFQDHNLDAGIAYKINRDMKVDLSGGFGLSKASNPNYVAIGFSFRLPVGKR